MIFLYKFELPNHYSMDSFWKYVPQITTPLAALCFITGIIYLIIRETVKSNNRRKEKSLTVQDPEAQRIAAENILKDYPDFTVGAISDDASKVELAKSIIASRSQRNQKAIYAFIFLAIIFSAVYLVSLVLGNQNDETIKVEKEFLKNKSWALLKAIKAKSPYATLSVIQHIKLRDVLIDGET